MYVIRGDFDPVLCRWPQSSAGRRWRTVSGVGWSGQRRRPAVRPRCPAPTADGTALRMHRTAEGRQWPLGAACDPPDPVNSRTGRRPTLTSASDTSVLLTYLLTPPATRQYHYAEKVENPLHYLSEQLIKSSFAQSTLLGLEFPAPCYAVQHNFRRLLLTPSRNTNSKHHGIAPPRRCQGRFRLFHLATQTVSADSSGRLR